MSRFDGILERDFQAQVIEVMGFTGWRNYHTWNSQRSVAGFPDLVALHPVSGDVLVAELKRERSRPTPAQLDWLGWFTGAGIDAYLWRPSNIEAIVARLQRPRARVAPKGHQWDE